MNTVLYEITYRLDREILIPPVIFLVVLFLIIREAGKIRQEKTARGHIVNLAVFSFGILISLTASILVITSQIDMYKNIIVPYEKGEYSTVAGYVEDFIPMPAEGHRHETFQINGIEFDYSDNTALQGYNNTRVYGGVISGNGQHLKIRYIYYEPWDCNVIVYIEELSQPSAFYPQFRSPALS